MYATTPNCTIIGLPTIPTRPWAVSTTRQPKRDPTSISQRIYQRGFLALLVNSYILFCATKSIAAVSTLCTSLLPAPPYSPCSPSSLKMVKSPWSVDLYRSARACPACSRLLTTLQKILRVSSLKSERTRRPLTCTDTSFRWQLLPSRQRS